MPGYPVAINPGPATQIGGASLTAHTTIVNTDSTNSVWLSSVRAVTPNNGIQLKPLGSMQWIADAQCFACVDAGVVLPVILNISSDVDQINDPLSIAIATAAELLTSGIPQVFNAEYVTDEVLGAGLTKTYPVGKYASLIFSADGNFLPTALDLVWHGDLVAHPISAPTLNDTLYSGRQFIDGAQLNVRAQNLDVINRQGDCHIQIIGTNRLLPKPIDTRANAEARSNWTATQTFIANSGVALADNGIGQKQGLTFAEITISNTVVKGVFFLQVPSATGVWDVNIRITDSNEMHQAPDGQWSISKQIILPSSDYEFVFRPSVGGAATVTINLIGGDT